MSDEHRRIGLNPITSDGCLDNTFTGVGRCADYEREWKDALGRLAAQEHAITELVRENNRRMRIIAAIVQKAGGMVALTYEDELQSWGVPVDVFGYRGELLVFRTAERSDPVGDEAAALLDSLMPVDATRGQQ